MALVGQGGVGITIAQDRGSLTQSRPDCFVHMLGAIGFIKEEFGQWQKTVA